MQRFHLTSQRSFSQLALAGLMVAMLSSVCLPCIAAVADQMPAPAQDSSGDCHPGNPGMPQNSGDCNCPAMISADQEQVHAAVPSARSSCGDEAPALGAFPVDRERILVSAILPDGLPAVPRLSPVRSFCIRLE